MTNLTKQDLIERYEELLDEVYEPAKIGYSEFMPSRIFKELDPIAYRVGFDDYINSLIEDSILSEEELKEAGVL
jgi:hypothetical protein